MQLSLLPYKSSSKSARKLIKGLGIKGIRVEGSKFVDKESKVVINWGSSEPPLWYKGKSRILNNFSAVAKTVDKLKALECLKGAGVSVPNFTTSLEEVKSLLSEDKKNRFIGRTLLKGSGGDGCHFISVREEDVEIATSLNEGHPPFKLFTQYVPKTAEYRVHVFNGEVFDLSQKKVKSSVDGLLPTPDYKIRSYDRGWVFCREDLVIPDGLQEVAIKSIEALGLDFGAVDIIWNRNKGLFVLEVNTSPGLEGQTLTNYINAFSKELKDDKEIIGG